MDVNALHPGAQKALTMAPRSVSDLNDEIYFLYREGRYTREDFERLWPQLLEIARKENDWEILSTVRMLSPKEWWQDKWRQVLEEINRKT